MLVPRPCCTKFVPVVNATLAWRWLLFFPDRTVLEGFIGALVFLLF